MTETSEKTDVTEYLARCGYDNVYAAKELIDRRYIAVLPYSFGKVRIIVGSLDNSFSFDQQIEFDSLDDAINALKSVGEKHAERT